MTSPEHVVLIGCGFTGTSAFYQLVDKYPVREITIFEKSGVFGPGLPYRSDECRDYLLNNTNDTLCLTPDNKRGFLNWLRACSDLKPDEIEERGNLPRVYYGYFLEDVFKATMTSAAIKNIKVNLITSEAKEISEDEQGKIHISWDGGKLTADKAILTTGHCPNIDHYQSPPSGSKTQYYPDHVNEKSLDHIPMEGQIYILGASLSAYDVIGRLFSEDTGCRFERGNDGSLKYIAGDNDRYAIMCSRSGRLKKMKSRKIKTVKREHFTLSHLSSVKGEGGLTLEDIGTAIKKDCALNDGKINWQEIIDPYENCHSAGEVDAKAGKILENDLGGAISSDERNILVDIFADAGLEIWDMFAARLLKTSEEKRFRRGFETATLTYEASCPISTAEKLLALHRAGRLKVIKGIKSVDFIKDDDAYLISHEFGQDKASILINTTGSVDRDVKSNKQSHIIKKMVSDGMLSPYKCGDDDMLGADVDMKDFRILGTNNIYMATMFLWGPGFYTSGAIIMATIVDRILKSLFNKNIQGEKR